MSIQRYTWDCVGQMESDVGEYVLHSDHAALLAAKDEEIAEGKRQRKIVCDDFEKLCRQLSEMCDRHGIVVETTYVDAISKALKESPHA